MLALPKGTPIVRSKRKIRSKRQDKAKETIQRIFDIGNDKDVIGTSANGSGLLPFLISRHYNLPYGSIEHVRRFYHPDELFFLEISSFRNKIIKFNDKIKFKGIRHTCSFTHSKAATQLRLFW